LTGGASNANQDGMKIRSVCVYCGSSVGRDPSYATAADRLGTAFANAGVRLVFGGGSVGLMGVVARAALRLGGEVNGIVPAFLKEREVALSEVSELIVTRDMHERKRLMFERSDAFVALPGGIGTLEEVVEMMTWVQLDRHRKPIVLVSHDGFWEPLIALLDHMVATGFLHIATNGPGLYQVVRDVDDVLPTLERAARALPEPEAEAAPDLM
jgi:uncharacterized protein (TIGR00730 family)